LSSGIKRGSRPVLISQFSFVVHLHPKRSNMSDSNPTQSNTEDRFQALERQLAQVLQALEKREVSTPSAATGPARPGSQDDHDSDDNEDDEVQFNPNLFPGAIKKGKEPTNIVIDHSKGLSSPDEHFQGPQWAHYLKKHGEAMVKKAASKTPIDTIPEELELPKNSSRIKQTSEGELRYLKRVHKLFSIAFSSLCLLCQTESEDQFQRYLGWIGACMVQGMARSKDRHQQLGVRAHLNTAELKEYEALFGKGSVPAELQQQVLVARKLAWNKPEAVDPKRYDRRDSSKPAWRRRTKGEGGFVGGGFPARPESTEDK
jgi:hypothetical protein